ncbi:LysR family transcriptional regulator [Thetidibacter halocola]|uniref:LysR family transcriptional regulator n=1 Tax=Thetidibacter halocola TaxID=2827239 RepID=A0A8J7WI84_9RHOB|nr:LysR family transcriptional regulator [Thetidibacter halocola]MBS0125756.1 LysR family transcriptional regulator [Thetidibacter halocola]
MDWRSVEFDWNRARAFLVTAEEGSLSAAARALNMAQPTLGRQVSTLEAELGVTLFERVGRGLQLTEAGTRLLDHARRMGDAAGALSLAARGQSTAVEGHVAITASEIYSTWLLPRILPRLRAEAPGITIEVVASNAIRDLKRREADIAIRNARPDQPDLIARLVAEDRGTFFATPAYLDRLGHIAALDDLARADFIGFDDTPNYIDALRRYGVPVSEANFPVIASTHPAHWQMARAGLGIGVGPCGLGDSDPDLRRVLPDGPFFDYPVWLVAHRELRTNPRVRLVWDVLADALPALLAEG